MADFLRIFDWHLALTGMLSLAFPLAVVYISFLKSTIQWNRHSRHKWYLAYIISLYVQTMFSNIRILGI